MILDRGLEPSMLFLICPTSLGFRPLVKALHADFESGERGVSPHIPSIPKNSFPKIHSFNNFVSIATNSILSGAYSISYLQENAWYPVDSLGMFKQINVATELQDMVCRATGLCCQKVF